MHSVALEWPEALDINALLGTGWRPNPFQEVVMKLHSRCNLACDYCYVYTLADQSWRHQPVRMSDKTLDEATARIAEHAARHKLPQVRVILHGGEPLLARDASLERLVNGLRLQTPANTSVMVSLQTNGVYLTDARLELLDRLGVEIGVSLDGLAADHDRHRLRPDGRGSHAASVAGLSRLRSARYRHLFRGILCTIDLRSDPVGTYDELARFEPPAVDFLLPHGNWTERPPGLGADWRRTPYADWLIRIFDHWYEKKVRTVAVRLFDEIMFQILGGHSRVDGLGLTSVPIVVIETDGSIQQSDFLKSAYSGAASTGLHVSRDSLDAALLLPPVAARQLGATALATTCRMCRIHAICGGGQYAHRYRAGYGFANPSVYCADLYRLIQHIRLRLAVDLAGAREAC